MLGDVKKEESLTIFRIPNLTLDAAPSPSHRKRAEQAAKPPKHTQIEAQVLADLTARRCSSTPKLLYHEHTIQDAHMWVPGGYLIIILMSKVPGTCLWDIWPELDESEKKLVRASFKESLT